MNESNNEKLYSCLVDLISNEYYDSKEEAKEIITTLYIYKQLTKEQFEELDKLINEIYKNEEPEE